jgi:hypothetical protein
MRCGLASPFARFSRGSALRRVEDALEAIGNPVRNGKARCPAHDDRTPSLSVSQGDSGALLHCHAGCALEAILAALELEKADLFDEPAYRERAREPREKRANGDANPQRICDYEYTDRHGELIARKIRYEPGKDGRPKSFEWEVPDGEGWRRAREGEGNPGVLYRLPELVEADEVHVGEGEKAADALIEAGFTATCPPTGKWAETYSEALRGKHVTIWQDRDEAGEKFSHKVYKEMHGIAASVRIIQSADTTPKADAFDHLAAGFSIEQAVQVDMGERSLDAIAFSGERLLALLDRPKPPPVEAGRPVPGHFTLLVAPPFVGKSGLIYWNAMARAAGVSPWSGAEARPAGRVLIYSLDEAPEQVVRRMNGLATFHQAGRLERYAERLNVIGPDRDLDPEALDGLRFDAHGIATLTRWLEDAERAGKPFEEVYIDAFSDMIPIGETENSNEEATRIGGALERLAVRLGCAIVLLHHTGKPKTENGDELPDVRFLGRGASALAAKARCVMSLEPMSGMPHLRRMRTATNLGPAPRSTLFEVCSENAATEELIYFKPTADPTDRDPREFLMPGQPISTNDLARLLAGGLDSDQEPPGEMKKSAAALRESWRTAGKVSVTPGKKGAKMIELIDNSQART